MENSDNDLYELIDFYTVYKSGVVIKEIVPKGKSTKQEWISRLDQDTVEHLIKIKQLIKVKTDKMEIKQGEIEANNVNHPAYYGGEDNPYEAIKVIEAWDLDFHLGNTIKYISRFGKKQNKANNLIEDLEKAKWYLERKIEQLKK